MRARLTKHLQHWIGHLAALQERRYGPGSELGHALGRSHGASDPCHWLGDLSLGVVRGQGGETGRIKRTISSGPCSRAFGG